MEAAVRDLAASIGATVLNVSTHRFAPQGLSCIAQISASHIALHTWPENRFASVDVFSCTRRVDAAALISLLRAAGLQPQANHQCRQNAESSQYICLK